MGEERVLLHGTEFEQRGGAWVASDTVLGANVTILPGAVLGRVPISVKAQTRQVGRPLLPPLTIGANCIIGAGAVLYRGARIGEDCLVGDTACVREQVSVGASCIIAMGVTINYNTRLGARVKVMDNTHLTGNMIVEDDVFISTLVSTTNDNSMGREAANDVPLEQRVRQGPIIRRFATIGQGACLLGGVEIGENTIVAANATVTRSLPAGVVAMGTPARAVRKLFAHEVRK